MLITKTNIRILNVVPMPGKAAIPAPFIGDVRKETAPEGAKWASSYSNRISFPILEKSNYPQN
jgi:hypothetical protein